MIELEVNNQRVLQLTQPYQYNDIEVTTHNKKDYEESYNIPAGDMVMLLNYYRYVKDNDIQCDFINYHGKNKML